MKTTRRNILAAALGAGLLPSLTSQLSAGPVPPPVISKVKFRPVGLYKGDVTFLDPSNINANGFPWAPISLANAPAAPLDPPAGSASGWTQTTVRHTTFNGASITITSVICHYVSAKENICVLPLNYSIKWKHTWEIIRGGVTYGYVQTGSDTFKYQCENGAVVGRLTASVRDNPSPGPTDTNGSPITSAENVAGENWTAQSYTQYSKAAAAGQTTIPHQYGIFIPECLARITVYSRDVWDPVAMEWDTEAMHSPEVGTGQIGIKVECCPVVLTV